MIVITGNPGVGKHTISKKLCSNLGLDLIDLNKVAIKNKIYDKKGATLDVDVGKLEKIVKKIAKKNSLVVGHLAPYALSKKQVTIAIVLRRSPYKLISVYKKRKYSKKKANENLGSEILGVTAYDAISKFGANKVFQIDTTSRTIAKTINKIKSILRKKGSGDNVDWLYLVTKNKDLAKFFK